MCEAVEQRGEKYLVGHTVPQYGVPEWESGAAVDVWSVLVSHIIGGSNRSWDIMEKTCCFHVNGK